MFAATFKKFQEYGAMEEEHSEKSNKLKGVR